MMIWKIKDRQVSFDRMRIVGILNITPDSFSDGGSFFSPEDAVRRALEIERLGADILDVGAESTRPGASAVSEAEELDRLLPVLGRLKNVLKIPISIDTTKPAVAEACLSAGAAIINDVSGLRDSGKPMAELAKKYGAGLILMHRRGNPSTMKNLEVYQDVIDEVLAELRDSVDCALAAGVEREQLVIDPGIGFAKNKEQNLKLIQGIDRFWTLGLPLMLGVSRKSFLGELTGQPVEKRDAATLAVTAFAFLKQIELIRVHEIEMTRDLIAVLEAIREVDHVRA